MQLKSKVKAVKPEKSYGHVSLSSKDFPFVKDAKLGTTIKVEVELKVDSLRAPDRWEITENNMKPTDVNLGGKICSVKPITAPKK